MSTVHQFPDSMQRAWRVYEGDLRAQFHAAGTASDVIEHVVSVMKPIYLKVSEPVTFNDNPAEAIDALNTWVRQQVSQLLFLLAIREAKLYLLGESQ